MPLDSKESSWQLDRLRLMEVMVQSAVDRDTVPFLTTGPSIPEGARGQAIRTCQNTHVMTRVLQRLCDLGAAHLIPTAVIGRVEIADDQNFHQCFKPVSILCWRERSYDPFSGALPREPLL